MIKECELLRFIEHAFRRDLYGMMNKIGNNTKRVFNSRNWTKWLFWVPGLLVPRWSIFYISLAIDRLFFHWMNNRIGCKYECEHYLWEAIADSNLDINCFFFFFQIFSLPVFCPFNVFVCIFEIIKEMQISNDHKFFYTTNSMHHQSEFQFISKLFEACKPLNHRNITAFPVNLITWNFCLVSHYQDGMQERVLCIQIGSK